MSANESKIYEIAVIGGGAAGVMSVLRGVLNNDEVLFFPGSAKDKKRSRGFWVAKVENMPGYQGYKKGIENPNKDTLEWIKESEFKDNLHTVEKTGVTSVEKLADGNFKLVDSNDGVHFAKYVVLCTGIMDVQPHFKESIQPILPYANAQTVDYCLRCDGHHVVNKHTSIIGHGNGAAWVAIMLKERYNTPSMSILTNGKEPEFSDEVKELIELYNIEVFNSEIVEVKGDKRAGHLHGYVFKSGREIESYFSFVSLGSIVYNELAKSIGAKVDDRGYVITEKSGMTDVENFYVAGDLRAGFKKQIYTAWDMAVDSLDDINRKIRSERRAKLLEEKRRKG
jgi:thioredoxin reductase (NADPH)